MIFCTVLLCLYTQSYNSLPLKVGKNNFPPVRKQLNKIVFKTEID